MSSASYPPSPVTLTGEQVSLIPLGEAHENDLIEATLDGELWRLWYSSVPSPDAVKSYIETALNEQALGKSLPFAVLRHADKKIVGTTRYMNIETQVRRLEIGSTWYATHAQRTAVNTECKYLLLQYAFESLECIAVEFRTHRFNEASRRAIQRLGAQQDGILRNHRIQTDGTFRDTVVYSILNSEWPVVKSHLRFKLVGGGPKFRPVSEKRL